MRKLLLLILLLAAVPPSAAVVRVADLYEAQVPVPDQGEAARGQALIEALAAVMARVSGVRPAAGGEVAAPAPEEAQRLVQQYRYVRGDEDRLLLHARFDPAGVDALLEKAGLPRWGEERPLTLVWLAVRDGTERTIASADAPGAVAEALRQQARARGVPLVLPLMDLQEQSEVTFTDIWGGFHDTVLAASRRYGAESVLIGRVERLAPDRWEARWTLVLQDGARQWQGTGERVEAPAAAAVRELAEVLAGRFAVRGDGEGGGWLRLSVTGVASLEDYARVAQALQSRESIQRARLREVGPDGLRYEVEVRGGADDLRRQLALTEQLAPVPPDAAPGSAPGGDELRYRLLP